MRDFTKEEMNTIIRLDSILANDDFKPERWVNKPESHSVIIDKYNNLVNNEYIEFYEVEGDFFFISEKTKAEVESQLKDLGYVFLEQIND